MMRVSSVICLVILPIIAPLGCAKPPIAAAQAAPAQSTSVSSSAAKSAPVSIDSRGPMSSHPDALGRMLEAPWAARIDKRRSVSFHLPDGANWTHVRFHSVHTLAGWRYGKDHHAVAASIVFPIEGIAEQANAVADAEARMDYCYNRFSKWAKSWARIFDVDIGEPRIDRPVFLSRPNLRAKVYALDAEKVGLFGSTRYAAGFAIYPSWKESCLIIGFAASSTNDEDAVLAAKLRDRVVNESLPYVTTSPYKGVEVLEDKSNL